MGTFWLPTCIISKKIVYSVWPVPAANVQNDPLPFRHKCHKSLCTTYVTLSIDDNFIAKLVRT